MSGIYTYFPVYGGNVFILRKRSIYPVVAIPRYMVWVEYRSDAERKRLENIVARMSGRARFTKPGGAVYIVETSDVEELARQLYSRLDPGVVHVYRIEEKVEPEPRVRRRRYVFPGASTEKAWGYIEMLMASLRAALVSQTTGTRLYRVYTRRKGRVDIEVAIVEAPRGALATLTITGYTGGVDAVDENIHQYLSMVAEER